jgi:ribosomal protein L11 methyltransferase
VSADDEDWAIALLWEAGTQGIEVKSEDGEVVMLAYFQEPADPTDALRALQGARVEPVAVPDIDWVARFRETFRAFSAGGFAIVPAWEEPPAAGRVIRIDPGRAFGTGTHETTRLCLATLEGLAASQPLGRVLDVGTGTGILAAAALLLGARLAVAADLDPDATLEARRHATLNALTLHVVRADGGHGFRDGAFDVVVANLSAPLLAGRRTELAPLLAPGGRLVLSGLLVTDLPEIEAAYRGLSLRARRTDGDWAALVLEARR